MVYPFFVFSQCKEDIVEGYILHLFMIQDEVSVMAERAPEITAPCEDYRGKPSFPVNKTRLDKALDRNITLH